MSEFLSIAELVLREKRIPLRAREITEYALENRLFSDRISGKTPHQTLKSKICQHIRHAGESSPFVRLEPGLFFLREFVEDASKLYHAPPLAKPDPKEHVLALAVSSIPVSERFQGILKDWKRFSTLYLRPENCVHIPRMEAEQISTHKQILTYVLLTRGEEVLAYKRGSWHRAGDFLKGVHCIGFGGHVTSEDASLWSENMGIRECAIREMNEELILPTKDLIRLAERRHLRTIGILNDDSSLVGQRHLAVIFQYEVSDDSAWNHPGRGEKAVTQLRWISPKTEKFRITEFEYWSQLCIREFFAPMLDRSAAFKVVRSIPFRHKHLLCVLGPVGSGKSEACRLLVEEFGYAMVNSGKIVAKLIGLPPVPETPRAKFQEEALRFIQTPDGPRVLGKAICDAVPLTGCDRVLVDGIRQKETLKCLREMASRFKVAVLYVHTPADQAFDFYKDREAPGATIEDFLEVRNASVEKEVMDMLRDADAVLYNWRGRESYQSAVRLLMNKLAITEL